MTDATTARFSAFDVAQHVDADPKGFILIFILVFGLGFVQYISTTISGIRDKADGTPLWAHVWYMAHDWSFIALFTVWFNDVDHWFYKAQWFGIVAFAFVEIWVTYVTLRDNRQELFEKHFGRGKEVTWTKGILGFLAYWAIALILLNFLRFMINDHSNLIIMLSCQMISCFCMIPLVLKNKSRKGMSMTYAWATLLGPAILTFAPAPFGMWTFCFPFLNTPMFYLGGLACVIASIYFIYLMRKTPKYKPEKELLMS
jgi:hypothetical protein